MPKPGEIRRAREIHPETIYVPEAGYNKYIWHACITCGKERWAILKNGVASRLHCQQCGCGSKQLPGSANSAWKGGRQTSTEGYIRLWVSPADFFFPMANKKGYIMEHRLVMAKHLGRCLHKWELVHHKGTRHPLGSRENKQDNRIENLMIIVTGNKGTSHTANIKCPYCSKEFKVK